MAGVKMDFFKRADKALEQEAATSGDAGKDAGAPTATVTTQPPVTATQTTVPPVVNQTTPAPTVQQTTPPPVSNQTMPAPVQGETTQPPAETEEQITRRYLASKGIDMDVDELVSKVTSPELTPDQKKKQDEKRQQRLLDEFIKGGGTMDEFFGIQNLTKIPDVDLVKADFFNQAKELNPDLEDDDLEELFTKQYFIGQKAGEYTAAEVKIGEAAIKKNAEAIRARKMEPISKIETELKRAEEGIESHKQWQKRVDQFAATLPRKLSFEIGKMGDKQTDLGTFEYELSDEEHKDFVNDLKDPAYLINAMKDETGKQIDLKKLSNLILRNRILEKALKASSYAAFSKGVETVSGPLNNYPDLRNLGGTQSAQSEDQKDRVEGERQMGEDSRGILGSSRGARRKPLSQRS